MSSPPAPDNSAESIPSTSFGAQTGLGRLVDANLNRAGEALRVVEDILRFGLNDSHLTRRCKHLRHQLGEVVQLLEARDFISARDTAGDCGRTRECLDEYRRESWSSLLAANCKRAEQALRSLEEACKTIDASLAQRCEMLRYETYNLEQSSLLLAVRHLDWAHVRLCVLVDAGNDEREWIALIGGLRDAGVDLIQLRDKHRGDRELLDRGRRLSELLRGSATRWVMNDRADLAVLAGADGVHVGQDDLPLREVRRLVGPAMAIGVSTHSISEAEAAVDAGATYLGVGPVFASPTKSFARLQGVALVRAVSELTALPAFAIGGITAANLSEVVAAGATRVAVGSGITAASDPAAAARELRAMLDSNLASLRSTQSG